MQIKPCVSLLQDINNQILSLNLSGAQIEVLSVDAQYSLQGGVTVLVTGRISAVSLCVTCCNLYKKGFYNGTELTPCLVQGQVPKSFVQTFFLATQEKGYYVLNDTFRYMSDPAKSQSSTYSDASTNGNPQQYPMQHEVRHVLKQT